MPVSGQQTKTLGMEHIGIDVIQAFCRSAILEMAKYCLSMLGGQDRQRLKSECFG
jgi:hypothetical protein